MFAILAALEQINVEAATGNLTDLTEYNIEPFKNLLPVDVDMPATFALADLFSEGLAEPNLVLVEKINSLLTESAQEIQRYITEYHDLYNEAPPAFPDEVQALEVVEPVMVEGQMRPEFELPGLEKGLVKAMDWSIDMDDKGHFNVDSGGILPATEIDPRDSTYKSENETLQQALDVVAVVDQLASPIRTGIAEDAYNKTIEGVNDGRQQ